MKQSELISREDVEMCLTCIITDMTIEEYIAKVSERIKALPSVKVESEE